MPRESFYKRFWISVGIVYAVGLFALGIVSFIILGTNSNRVHDMRSQHDLFLALSGRDLEYGYEKAFSAAEILRDIPIERLEEDFTYMRLLANTRETKSMAESIIVSDPSNAERILVYAEMFTYGSGSYISFLDDMMERRESRETIKSVLKGADPPVVSGINDDIGVKGEFVFMWIIVMQFVAFGFYCIATSLSRELDMTSYSYNPGDLPSGFGPKLSLMFTLPGSTPLVVLVLVINTLKYGFSSRKKATSHLRRSSGHTLSSQSTYDSLRKLKSRSGSN